MLACTNALRRATMKPYPGADSYEEFEAIMASIEGNGPQTTLFDLLLEDGIALPQPEDVADDAMWQVLWNVIDGMASQGAYLSSTNHLSDRELYSKLWSEILREEHPVVPDDYPLVTDIDILGGWRNEDMDLFLKYYADDEERRGWAAEGKTIPEHEDPPYSRDHLLPG
jgi:hypothetical protein